MTDIYPEGLLPDTVHPFSKYLLGFGLQPKQIAALAPHLGDDLGMRMDEARSQKVYAWAVDHPREIDGRDPLTVGEDVNILVSDRGAVRIIDGALPPGLRLERHTGRIVGTPRMRGLFGVTVEIGPAVKYDTLGGPGGPNDPGVWIDFHARRHVPESRLGEFPASVADLSDREKDQLLAELQLERARKAAVRADD